MSIRTVTLTRVKTGDQGTFGSIAEYFGESLNFLFFTAELPWRDNKESISCIPVGHYRCQWTISQHFPAGTFQVMGVPKRTGIRIHKGNWSGDVSKGFISDVLGCILLGKLLQMRQNSKGDLQQGVFDSTIALSEFKHAMGDQPFDLEIVEQFT